MPSHAKTLLLVISLVACDSGGSKRPPATGSGGSAGSATGSAAAQPVTPDAAVDIYVDEQPVGKLALAQVAMWPRLDSLVPVSARRLGTWQTITLRGAKSTDINQPSSTHPDLVAAIFPGEGGAPSFGMFDPVELAKKGKPALREDAIREVRIKLASDGMRGQNDHGDSAAADPAKIELLVKTAAGEQVIKGAKLLETPREAQPGQDDGGKGWPLATILKNAGVTKYERLRLTGENGTNLTLEKIDLDPKTSTPFVKLNRQGTLRFRVFKKEGDTWQPGQDLRGLVSIEVLK